MGFTVTEHEFTNSDHVYVQVVIVTSYDDNSSDWLNVSHRRRFYVARVSKKREHGEHER
jgi:hypothetical protein